MSPQAARGISLLVLDCLANFPCSTHFSLTDALELARRLKPKRTLLVGMSCDAFPDHVAMNAELRSLTDAAGLDVQFARDGQVVDLDL